MTDIATIAAALKAEFERQAEGGARRYPDWINHLSFDGDLAQIAGWIDLTALAQAVQKAVMP